MIFKPKPVPSPLFLAGQGKKIQYVHVATPHAFFQPSFCEKLTKPDENTQQSTTFSKCRDKRVLAGWELDEITDIKNDD